jgi:nucleoside 2-deoxyribosyltransferase
MSHSKKVYISGALTEVNVNDPTSLKRFYESIAELCKTLGMKPYVPHLNSDPVVHPHLDPKQVYEMDKREIAGSDIVIAYVGFPSLGVGQEIEIARENEVPVILLYEQSKRISRMARGNPAVIAQIAFADFEDGLRQLRSVLLSEGSRSAQQH